METLRGSRRTVGMVSGLWTLATACLLFAPLPPGSVHALNNPVAKPTSGFRGDGSGLYPDSHPPIEWGDQKNVKWRTRVGKGYSSPVVSKGNLYVTSDPPE